MTLPLPVAAVVVVVAADQIDWHRSYFQGQQRNSLVFLISYTFHSKAKLSYWDHWLLEDQTLEKSHFFRL